MNQCIPSFLKPGDRVGVWAPARFVIPSLITKGMQLCTRCGLELILPDGIFEQEHQFAGNDSLRTAVFNQWTEDAEIKAVICAKGGYGAMRILSSLNDEAFRQNPKWVVGYSDVTAVHAWLNHSLRIPSIHGMMLSGMEMQGDRFHASMSMIYALYGQLLNYRISSSGLLTIGLRGGLYPEELKINPPAYFRSGRTRARLLGGNLSLLYALSSTPYDLPTSERFILFFEDLDEYLYHVDRMMQQFLLSRKLNRLAGVIVGGMTEMKDNPVPFGKSAHEIVREYLAPLDIPVFIGFPAGHIDLNLALYLGAEVDFMVGKDGNCVLEFLNLPT